MQAGNSIRKDQHFKGNITLQGLNKGYSIMGCLAKRTRYKRRNGSSSIQNWLTIRL